MYLLPRNSSNFSGGMYLAFCCLLGVEIAQNLLSLCKALMHLISLKLLRPSELTPNSGILGKVNYRKLTHATTLC